MDIKTPIENIPRVGPVYKSRLTNLEIYTAEDLLWHIPFRYEDTSKISLISEAKEALNYTIKGDIVEIKNIYTRYGKKLTNAVIKDSTGVADIVWFNQQYVTQSIKVGTQVILYGKIEPSLFRPKFISPGYEVIRNTQETTHLARITGIYPETKGISSKWLRMIIKYLIQEVKTPLREAFQFVHFPKDYDEIEKGKEILAFQEMLKIQYMILLRKIERNKRKGIAVEIDLDIYHKFISTLKFDLTIDQQNTIEDIYNDLKTSSPMNRLLEGDVGSGKTVVASAAILQVLNKGLQSILLAPTSILAMQHYLTLKEYIPKDSIGLVTAKHKNKEEFLKPVIIGTHAVIFGKEKIENVGLVVIDEQHRFGVRQREELEKFKPYPHILTMSATPIPRTLAMALYADIDLSLIKTMPSMRKPISTHIVPTNKRNDAYSFITKAIAEKKEQVYVICPLIEESEKVDAKSVILEHERLKTKIFPQFNLGLLHGALSAKEKDAVLSDFKNQIYDILVSTSVIEVGIDVPNSTIMLIEGAEKFGLAQLHQLRGRVGRSDKQSYCFLFPSNIQGINNGRLKFFCNSHNGIELAEFDLQQRGPGEVYGTRQAGLPNIKVAKFNDIKLIERARKEAQRLIDSNEKLE